MKHPMRAHPVIRAGAVVLAGWFAITSLGACSSGSDDAQVPTTAAATVIDTLEASQEALATALDSLLSARLASASGFLAQIRLVARSADAVQDALESTASPDMLDPNSRTAISDAAENLAAAWAASDIRACQDDNRPDSECAGLDFTPIVAAARALLDTLEAEIARP